MKYLGGLSVTLAALLAAMHFVPRSLQADAPPPTQSCNGLEATIVAEPGQTIIQGTPHNDVIVAAYDEDYSIDARQGNDFICVFGHGDLVVESGTGNDYILVTGNGSIYLDAGTGNDHVELTGSGTVVVDLGGGNDYFAAMQAGHVEVDAGSGNDLVYLGDGGNLIDLGSGDDTLESGYGDDFVEGQSGNNQIVLLGGNNTIYAGSGNDNVTTGEGDDFADLGSGNDILVSTGGDNFVEADNGNDQITTGWGDDFIYEENGSGIMDAGEGFDTCIGGNGNDQAFNCEEITDAQNMGTDDDAPPVVTFISPTQSATNSEEIAITIAWQDNTRVEPDTAIITINEIEVTTQFSIDEAGAHAMLPVDEGVVSIEVRVSDFYGNEGQGSASIIVDRTAPEIVATFPSDAAVFEITDVAIAATLTDTGSGIDVTATLLHLNDQVYEVTGSSQVFFSPVSGFAEGTYIWRLEAKDQAGNVTTTSNRMFTIQVLDTEPPIVTGSIPEDGAVLETDSEIFLVFFHEDDKRGVTGAEIRFSNATVGVFEQDVSAFFTVTPVSTYAYIDAADPLPYGDSQLKYVAIDGAGNRSATFETSFFIDVNRAPIAHNKQVATFTNSSLSSVLTAHDPDGDVLYFEVFQYPSFGTLTVDKDTGQFVYFPQEDFTGFDHFVYHVSDGVLFSQPALVQIEVAEHVLPETGPLIRFVGGEPTIFSDQFTSGTLSSVWIPSGNISVTDDALRLHAANFQGVGNHTASATVNAPLSFSQDFGFWVETELRFGTQTTGASIFWIRLPTEEGNGDPIEIVFEILRNDVFSELRITSQAQNESFSKTISDSESWLARPLTATIQYIAASQELIFRIEPLEFAQNITGQIDASSRILTLESAVTTESEVSEIAIFVDKIDSNLELLENNYATSFWPYQYDDIFYAASILQTPGPALNYIGALPLDQQTVTIGFEDTLIPVDGETNLNLLLARVPQFNAGFAIITPLPASRFLQELPVLQIDHYFPDKFVANGFGFDYITNGENPPDTFFLSDLIRFRQLENFAIEFSSDKIAKYYQCRLNSGSWEICSSPYFVHHELGSNSLLVRAFDFEGNVDPTPATYTWETVAFPKTELISTPGILSASGEATFRFASNMPALFECSLNGAPFQLCTETLASIGTTWYTGLNEGAHVFSVRAISAFELVESEPATHEWVIDFGLTPPIATSLSPDDGVFILDHHQKLYGFHQPGSAVVVDADVVFEGTDLYGIANFTILEQISVDPVSTQTSIPDYLPDGFYSWFYAPVDAIGISGNTLSHQFGLDRHAPSIEILNLGLESTIRNSRFVLIGRIVDLTPAGLSINGTTALFDGSGYFQRGIILDEGVNTIVVEAEDSFGRQSEKIVEVTFHDPTAGPAIYINAPLNFEVLAAPEFQIDVTFTDADGVDIHSIELFYGLRAYHRTADYSELFEEIFASQSTLDVSISNLVPPIRFPTPYFETFHHVFAGFWAEFGGLEDVTFQAFWPQFLQQYWQSLTHFRIDAFAPILGGLVFENMGEDQSVGFQAFEEGKFDLGVRVKDALGNESQKWIQVSIDSSAPELLQLEPPPGVLVLDEHNPIRIIVSDTILATTINPEALLDRHQVSVQINNQDYTSQTILFAEDNDDRIFEYRVSELPSGVSEYTVDVEIRDENHVVLANTYFRQVTSGEFVRSLHPELSLPEDRVGAVWSLLDAYLRPGIIGNPLSELGGIAPQGIAFILRNIRDLEIPLAYANVLTAIVNQPTMDSVAASEAIGILTRLAAQGSDTALQGLRQAVRNGFTLKRVAAVNALGQLADFEGLAQVPGHRPSRLGPTSLPMMLAHHRAMNIANRAPITGQQSQGAGFAPAAFGSGFAIAGAPGQPDENTIAELSVEVLPAVVQEFFELVEQELRENKYFAQRHGGNLPPLMSIPEFVHKSAEILASKYGFPYTAPAGGGQ